MKIFRGYHEITQAFARPIVTIGNFDGLHLGHRQIIHDVVERAKKVKGTSIAYTFRPHPHLALTPEEDLQLINTYDEKLDLLASLGIQVTIEEPFSREFSTIAPEKFFSEVLVKRLSPEAIYVGYDFAFGRNRAGTLDLLKRLCKDEGVELHVAKPLKVDGEVPSSSRIRGYLKTGDVAAANHLLGREFFYRGLVVRGKGRGHSIGFATANVRTESKFLIQEGVYATWALHGGRVYSSVTNVGRQPTFNRDGDAPIAVETHILDFDKDIYGEILEVRMVARLREEIKFDGVNSLVTQIKKDVEKARALLVAAGKGAK
jgi:riboflavin kinase/FMN adenylyltransferase